RGRRFPPARQRAEQACRTVVPGESGMVAEPPELATASLDRREVTLLWGLSCMSVSTVRPSVLTVMAAHRSRALPVSTATRATLVRPSLRSCDVGRAGPGT